MGGSLTIFRGSPPIFCPRPRGCFTTFFFPPPPVFDPFVFPLGYPKGPTPGAYQGLVGGVVPFGPTPQPFGPPPTGFLFFFFLPPLFFFFFFSLLGLFVQGIGIFFFFGGPVPFCCGSGLFPTAAPPPGGPGVFCAFLALFLPFFFFFVHRWTFWVGLSEKRFFFVCRRGFGLISGVFFNPFAPRPVGVFFPLSELDLCGCLFCYPGGFLFPFPRGWMHCTNALAGFPFFQFVFLTMDFSQCHLFDSSSPGGVVQILAPLLSKGKLREDWFACSI